MRIRDDKATGAYFLDIDLHTDMNGLMLAQHIRRHDPHGYIVFVTTHDEMTPLTFEYKVEALDYIVKDAGDLPEKLRACLDHIHQRSQVTMPQDAVFSIRVGDKLLIEDYKSICLFEVAAAIHKVVMVADRRQVEFYSSLSAVEKCLDGRFVRCSDSAIVNVDKIAEIDRRGRLLTLTNGDQCAVSVRNIKTVMAALSAVGSRK